MCEELNELTPRMRAGIEYRIEHPRAGWGELAEACGVSRSAVDKWRKTEKWQKALDAELHRVFKEAQTMALNRMMDIAMNGNDTNAFNATKFLLENGGFKAADNLNVSGDMGVSVSIDYGD